MAVQWGLAQPQGGGFDYLESLQAIGQQQALRQRTEQNQYAFAQQQRQDQARVGLSNRARGGDYAGARQEAAFGGDFDFANALSSLDEDKLKRLSVELDAIGQIHPTLKGLPVEQRAAVATAALSRVGFSPEELANMDWSDAGLDASYQMSAAGKAALAARTKAAEPYTLSPGSKRMSGDQLIADNPAAEKPIWDSERGSLIYPSQFAPGGGAQSDYAPAPQPQPPATGGGFHIAGLPGERVTSTYRTPAHNAEVGGVGNSYHTRRDAQGNPLARDSVPPSGMSMGAYAARLRSENPDKDVINEGDHVHIEPRDRGLRSAPQSRQPGVVNVVPPKERSSARDRPPSGYRWKADGGQEAIPGGPADPNTATNRNVQSNRKAEADFRNKFDALPEVKNFKTARQQFNALRNIAGNKNATAQDDIAAIFSFMKTLDPNSTVREGEFATAQNAAGISDSLRNGIEKLKNGERLNASQRKEMIRTAYRSYKSFRDAYNQSAESYRGYAKDYGIAPDRVARTYTPDKPAAQQKAAPLKAGETRKIGRFVVRAVN